MVSHERGRNSLQNTIKNSNLMLADKSLILPEPVTYVADYMGDPETEAWVITKNPIIAEIILQLHD